MEREIVREGNGGAGNVILGIVVALILILAVWAFATGKFGNLTGTQQPATTTETTNVKVEVPTPSTNTTTPTTNTTTETTTAQ